MREVYLKHPIVKANEVLVSGAHPSKGPPSHFLAVEAFNISHFLGARGSHSSRPLKEAFEVSKYSKMSLLPLGGTSV